MAFEDYLETIKSDSDGENVSSAISNALLYLTSGAEPIYEADVTEEAATVASSAYGKDVKGAIYSALKKISDSGETSLIIIELSQAEYDALEVKDQTQVYGITDNPHSESPYEYKYSKCYLGTVELERIFIGDTQVWGSTPTPPGPAWDETRIAVVKLDSDDEPTDSVMYFETIADSKAYLTDNAESRYLVHIGESTGISTIGNAAYNSCTALRRIDLPDSITGIGYAAFYATSLAEITIPNSVTSMSEQPFAHCTSLTRVVLPNSITAIPNSCFSGCTLLNDVEIPDGVTGIDNFVFNDCASLTNISIPSSVRAITPYGFYGTTNLTITIDKPEGSISGAPWGATNATITWTG